VRGGLAVRLASLVLGLLLFAAGIVGFLKAGLGLPPWDVLHQGVAERTPLTFGLTNIAVGLVVLLGAWGLGARIGIGTVANAVVVGVFIDGLLALDAVQGLAEAPLGARVGLLGLAIVFVGAGTAFYIGADLGAGPRDSLMLVGSLRSGRRVGVVRAVIELAVLGLGFVLGGTAGVGTVAFALLIGPSVELGFGALRRSPLVAPPRVDAVAPQLVH